MFCAINMGKRIARQKFCKTYNLFLNLICKKTVKVYFEITIEALA